MSLHVIRILDYAKSTFFKDFFKYSMASLWSSSLVRHMAILEYKIALNFSSLRGEYRSAC